MSHDSTPAPTITFEEFSKVDLRVGRIRAAERHKDPKVTKLLVLTVDLGEETTRTILAGIALHYTPEELVGRNIIVVANLAPREMRGYVSHGMLLAAGDSRPYLLGVDGPAPGDRVG